MIPTARDAEASPRHHGWFYQLVCCYLEPELNLKFWEKTKNPANTSLDYANIVIIDLKVDVLSLIDAKLQLFLLILLF